MASSTTPRSSFMAAGTCTPLSGKSATGFVTCLPSKSGVSTAASHLPVLSASLPESSSKSPQRSLPILLPIIYTPSGDPVARSSWSVTSGLHAVPESSSGKPPQSPCGFSQFVATVRPYPTHSPVPALVGTAAWPLIPNSHVSNSHNSYSARDGLPSNANYEPFRPSPTTTITLGTITSTSSGIPGRLQSIYSTATWEVTETPQSTFPTPVSIAETTDDQPTVCVPPSTTSIGQTTLAGGAVASATQVVSNPVQDASNSSVGHSFFGNHAAVVSVFLATGISIACAVVIAIYYHRRRKRQTQCVERKIQNISPPFTISKPYGLSSNLAATKQTFFSVPLNHSGDSLSVAHSKPDIPVPQPVPQLRKSRSSHRVPVRYSGLDEYQGNSRTADRKYDGPFSDYRLVQVVPPLPSLNVPPPLPERSPLRLLAAKNSLNNSLNTPQEDPNRLSGASSLSIYPPSSSTSEAVVASENNLGMDHWRRRATQAPGLSNVLSDGASSSWRAQRSLVESSASGTGPAQPSILDEVTRMYNARQLVRYKVR